MTGSGDDLGPEDRAKLREWRQGDFAWDRSGFLVATQIASDGPAPALVKDSVVGLVVVSQTCDIVNFGPGKQWVVACPLVEVDEQSLPHIQAGRTPAFALVDGAPTCTVADLGRMMSLQKKALAGMERQPGCLSDHGRRRFACALERKFGRFAFPDDFSRKVLKPLRDRIREKHGKSASEVGRVYRSIDHVRVTASPSWLDHDKISVGFRFVVAPEETREAELSDIDEIVRAEMKRVRWPDKYRPQDPPYFISTMDDMTARDWVESIALDFNFLSWDLNE